MNCIYVDIFWSLFDANIFYVVTYGTAFIWLRMFEIIGVCAVEIVEDIKASALDIVI
jgi:hypothetical protein